MHKCTRIRLHEKQKELGILSQCTQLHYPSIEALMRENNKSEHKTVTKVKTNKDIT